MKLLITGSSKLAGALLEHKWPRHWYIDSARIEDILCGDINVNEYDVFLNCAHVDFKQCWLVEYFHYAWLKNRRKYIINFSSRAAKPNISKGLMYSTQKAALNHLCDLITYTTDKLYRMTVLNLGLLERPGFEGISISYKEICELLETLIQEHYSGSLNEVSEVTFQHIINYKTLQEKKKGEQQGTR